MAVYGEFHGSSLSRGGWASPAVPLLSGTHAVAAVVVVLAAEEGIGAVTVVATQRPSTSVAALRLEAALVRGKVVEVVRAVATAQEGSAAEQCESKPRLQESSRRHAPERSLGRLAGSPFVREEAHPNILEAGGSLAFVVD